MDITLDAKRIKIFKSKYLDFHHEYWAEVKNNIEELGVPVYDKKADCDLAMVLNAMMFNPSVFENKVGFIYSQADSDLNSWDFWIEHICQPILEKYYNHLINLYPLRPKEAADKIVGYVNEIN